MERTTRGLSVAAYLVGGTLMLLPLVDASLSIAPFTPGEVRWRFGAAGLMASALLLPNAGLLLLLATAIVNGHTVVRRVVGILALAGAVVCVLGTLLFILDAIQTRPQVRPGMTTSFIVASVVAVMKLLIAAATQVAIGLVGV